MEYFSKIFDLVIKLDLEIDLIIKIIDEIWYN